MNGGIDDVFKDNKLVIADKKTSLAKRNFKENMNVLNADDLLTRLGEMKYISGGCWKKVNVQKVESEIEKYQSFIYYETD